MYILVLNLMRGSYEERRPIARAETIEELEALMERERVEPYHDDNWYKVFRRGGPLEWFNPPDSEPHIAGPLTQELYLQRANEQWMELLQIPPVGTL